MAVAGGLELTEEARRSRCPGWCAAEAPGCRDQPPPQCTGPEVTPGHVIIKIRVMTHLVVSVYHAVSEVAWSEAHGKFLGKRNLVPEKRRL